MMLILMVFLVSVSFAGCKTGNQPNQDNSTQTTDVLDKQSVTNQVTGFGNNLSMVSLQAPNEEVSKNIQQYYSPYVSEQLLIAWQQDPRKAPGRLVSSPWPDHIDVLSTTKVSADTYEVKGEIIYLTNVEKANGGAAAKNPVTLLVKKYDNRWLIDQVNINQQ